MYLFAPFYFRNMSSRTSVKKQRPATFGTQGRAKSAVKSNKEKRGQRQAVARAVAKKSAGYVDLANAPYNNDTTGSIALIATIAQGAAVTQRIGKKAVYKSLQMRGFIQSNANTTVADAAILIVYDREPTNTLPAITDILNTASAASFLNDVNSDRFKIVRRFDYTLTGNSTTPATGNEAHSVDEYIDLKGMPVQFKAAATGAIGDLAIGALYVVTVGNQVAGLTAAQSALGFRTRFYDVDG